jgi:alkylation response protein AidB-like acyl-CoA dehydrogenase
MTVKYAKDRKQFGRPIGSFQAVQHHCANMVVDVDGSRFMTYQAAWKISEGLGL